MTLHISDILNSFLVGAACGAGAARGFALEMQWQAAAGLLAGLVLANSRWRLWREDCAKQEADHG